MVRHTPTDPTLAGMTLLTAERQLIAAVINRFGAGGHPMADDSTLDYFTLAYTRWCLQRAIDARRLTSHAAAMALDLLPRLTAH